MAKWMSGRESRPEQSGLTVMPSIKGVITDEGPEISDEEVSIYTIMFGDRTFGLLPYCM